MFGNALNFYWKDQCDEDCQGCEFASPADEYEDDESYYRDILRENSEIYEELTEEYN